MVAFPFNIKARLWLMGRVKWASKLQKKLHNAGFSHDRPVIWMHASSLGEYEQGKPVLDAIKEKYNDVQCVITFFSPSGYEVVKQHKSDDNNLLPAYRYACQRSAF
jgi:3-deoxy-D-manno-octulosonic-acid transferase